MSLILDALKKAKQMAGRKSEPATPAALGSFRFGRPTRAERIRKMVLVGVMGAIGLSATAYTISFIVARYRKPSRGAVLIQAPRPALEESIPVEEAAAAEVPKPDPPKNETIKPQSPPSPAKPVAQAQEAPAAPRRAAAAPTPTPPADRPIPVQQASPAASIEASPYRARPSGPPQPVPVSVATDVAPESSLAAPPARTASPSGRGEVTPPVRDPFDLAVFYQRSGDFLKALDQYNKVLEKDPLNPSVYNNLGLIHYSTRNTPEAIKAFRQATYIDPKYDTAHNNLGLALQQAGQTAEAEREFERALQLNPKNAAAMTNLAALARKSGNIERAKIQYLQAIQVNPGNAEAHYNLAMLYEEQGENGSAVEHFKKFLMLGSNSHPEVVADVEKKIEELSKKKE
jgi:Flp pilus assembly protein TadD